MKKLLTFTFILAVIMFQTDSLEAVKENTENDVMKEEISNNHKWKQTSSEMKMVHADSHDYDVWRNFIKKTVTCDITHKIKTEVWYCELHNHTKSEVSLEETIHSYKH
ncbi:hypothetical protein NC661_09995 [Aquibacillus koreensis]|uniref:Uncharacterized protein n=1 Tax=Aquibacillus koreensis TaxID=279446 RepID=A0A9X4AIF8_9BACI|nr:hypothetical protein [Aquibacillus koreensis]MCT2534256.1 hypothetical protein [Aquibacillus koreensis]MDC3420699.1 hypothetical protein [Aquibacillus koreensis]